MSAKRFEIEAKFGPRRNARVSALVGVAIGAVFILGVLWNVHLTQAPGSEAVASPPDLAAGAFPMGPADGGWPWDGNVN